MKQETKEQNSLEKGKSRAIDLILKSDKQIGIGGDIVIDTGNMGIAIHKGIEVALANQQVEYEKRIEIISLLLKKKQQLVLLLNYKKKIIKLANKSNNRWDFLRRLKQLEDV